MNVYGNGRSGHLAEDAPAVPANQYAASKLAIEMGAVLWADRVRLTLARPFSYTGVGQDERYLVAKIVAHFRRRDPLIELGNLEIARDFGDVRAVASAYVGLLDRGSDDTFNICTGVVHTLGDVVTLCERITGHRMEVTVNPAFVRHDDVAVLAGDPGRLRRALPEWRPLPLEDTLAWMSAA